MARRKLTEKEKKSMQSARTKSGTEKETAKAFLAENQQFTNPRFWNMIEPDIASAVEKAICASRKAAKKAEIARLQKKIDELQKDL